MGRRLYPMTADKRKLEVLAGVSPGTADRYRRVCERCAELSGTNGMSMHDHLHAVLDADHELDEFHCFELYGWGKFVDPAGVELGCAGKSTDLDLCADIMELHVNLCGGSDIMQRVFVDYCEGFCWS